MLAIEHDLRNLSPNTGKRVQELVDTQCESDSLPNEDNCTAVWVGGPNGEENEINSKGRCLGVLVVLRVLKP